MRKSIVSACQALSHSIKLFLEKHADYLTTKATQVYTKFHKDFFGDF
jgi:hypothetical protein